MISLGPMKNGPNVSEQIFAAIRYFGNDNVLQSELRMPCINGVLSRDFLDAKWEITFREIEITNIIAGREVEITFRLISGESPRVAVSCGLSLSNLAPNAYILFPAAIYDGNRFSIKDVPYPPLWRDPKEFRLDMPTTVCSVPHLGGPDLSKAIRLNSGDVAFPLIGIHDPVSERGYILLTSQQTPLGSNGLEFEEGNNGLSATMLATTPAVRRKDSIPTTTAILEERAGKPVVSREADILAHMKAGDSVTLKVQIYSFPSVDVSSLLDAVTRVRTKLNPAERKEAFPFSAAFRLEEELYAKERWDEEGSFFWLTPCRPGEVAQNWIWQLGWIGGGQITLGFLQNGNALSRERSLRNLAMIFEKTQTASGFFYGMGDGHHFFGDGFSKPHPYNMSMIRKQADWLYFAIKHFRLIEAQGAEVHRDWKKGTRRLAESFVSLWNRYGQFGQFVNVETGDLVIGGSCAGAMAVGGLALASEYFGDRCFLEVAERAAEQYDEQYVKKGLTTGGPGEILSAPDSESAFSMLESFVVLYEVTNEPRFLDAALRAARLCATWVVSYDFKFPSNSPLGRIKTHSRGAVWANVQNRHGAPGICTFSGDSLLRLWRATGDSETLNLLEEISHGITQYISRADRPVGTMRPGAICERVNLSDWEGKDEIGGNIFDSCSFTETAVVLTFTEVPGLYVQPDTGFFRAFDNIEAQHVKTASSQVALKLTNPTQFLAEVTTLVETSQDAKFRLPRPALLNVRRISIQPGESRIVEFDLVPSHARSGRKPF